MAETAEPLPNPVIKEEWGEAKARFREEMQGIAPVKEPEPEPSLETGESDAKPKPDKAPSEEVSKDGATPSKVLPDDVLEPKTKEPDKTSVISEIEAAELPKGAKETTIKSFAELKAKSIAAITESQSKIQEIEKRLSEAKTNKEVEALNEKLKKAESKAAEIEDQWAKVSLETSPQFQNQFVKREKAALEAAQAYLEGTEVDKRVIDYAARNSGAARLKILEDAGLDPKQIGAVEARLAQYDTIQRDKADAIDHWREQGAAWQEAEQKRVDEEKAKRSEFENKVWEKTLSKNANLLPFRSSKDETWNSQAETFRNEARDIFLGKGADPETMADVVQRGVVARSGFYDKIIEHLTNENKLVREENAKLKSAAPGGAVSSGATPPSKENERWKSKNPVEREEESKRVFNEQMQRERG